MVLAWSLGACSSAEISDAGFFPDAAAPDAAHPDALVPDAGFMDAAAPDAAEPDAGSYSVSLSASSTTALDETPIVLTAVPLGETSTIVRFLEGGTEVARSTTAPFVASLSYTVLDNGTHRYRAIASAASGAQATSAEIEIRVDVHRSIWVEPVAGDDTHSGHQDAPFQSLFHALSVATAGDVIHLLGGSYTAPAEHYSGSCMTVPAGVSIRGEAAGAVRLQGPAGNGTCALAFTGGGAIEGVDFDGFGFALQFRGHTVVHSVHVTNCSSAFEVTTGGTVDIDGAQVDSFHGDAFGVPIALVETGAMRIVGGEYSGDSNGFGGMFLARGAGELTLEGTSIHDNSKPAIIVYDNAQVILRQVSIDHSSPSGLVPDSASIRFGGQNTAPPLSTSLRLEGTTIQNAQGHAIGVAYYTNLASHLQIRLSGSAIRGSAGDGLIVNGGTTNFNAGLSVSVDVDSSTIAANGRAGINGSIANLTVRSSLIRDNASEGIRTGVSGFASQLLVRGSTLARNRGDTIWVEGDQTSVDLGTTAAAGHLWFSGVPAGKSALRLSTMVSAHAVGDRFMPSVQGADAAGAYPALSTQMGPLNGLNFNLVSGASVEVGP